jgi:hypothetical protein
LREVFARQVCRQVDVSKVSGAEKLQVPSSKFQRNAKSQAPMVATENPENPEDEYQRTASKVPNGKTVNYGNWVL